MSQKISDYECIIGKKKVNEIISLAKSLNPVKKILMINTTKEGGGVAELLHSYVPLFNSLGFEFEWICIDGDEKYYMATKMFFNMMQGEDRPDAKKYIEDYEKFFANRFSKLNPKLKHRIENLNEEYLVIVHDPQPIFLSKFRKDDGSKWIWRCHMDTHTPNNEIEEYLNKYIENFDVAITSKKEYILGAKIPWFIIPPSIDPLKDKNIDMNPSVARKRLKEAGIPLDLPIISQAARLDKWKDPIGVIEAFRRVRDDGIKCRLVLMYNGATDDPEGKIMLEEVKKEVTGKYKNDIILARGDDPFLVNALQRTADVMMQKSTREAFALTVSEALWKETPVIGTRVGGIPLQIKNSYNGFLVENYHTESEREKHLEETKEYLKILLTNNDLNEKMGKKGKDLVKEKFLITRVIRDYLLLFHKVIK